jgi:hypothetical protein
VLRALWGGLVFGRVSRVVCRACDCNIWWHPNGKDNPKDRKFLGDNRDVLRQYSRQQVERHISIEYDYYYGFCGQVRSKDLPSLSVPKERVTPKVSRVVVTQDLDALGTADLSTADQDLSEKAHEDANENFHLEADRGKGAATASEDRDFYESSFHFSSTNYAEPRLFSAAAAPVQSKHADGYTGDDANLSDLLTCEDRYSVIPPETDQLICGWPSKSSRGITLSRWWFAPEAFFQLWKMVTSTQDYSTASTSRQHEMLRLLRCKGSCRFYQEVAQVALFGQVPNSEKLETTTRRFLRDVEILANAAASCTSV